MNNPGTRAGKKMMQRPDATNVGHVAVAEGANIVPPINRCVVYSVDASYSWSADEFLDRQHSTGGAEGTGNNDIEKTRPCKTLITGSKPALDESEDRGVDPYNTGQFISA